MTETRSSEALRREALCLQAQAIIDGGGSLNLAARKLGEPVANLHRYLARYRAGGFEGLIPKQENSGRESLRAFLVAQIGEEAMAEAERRVAGLVRGPHLRAVRREHRRNRTGCVGISISRSARGKTYYVANLGSTNRRFCIETLGRAEAFKRALQARAKHELTVQAANEVILAARNTNGHLTITPQDAHGA